MDRSKKSGSKIGKLRVGFASFVLIRRFSEILDVSRSEVKQFEDNVNNLRLAGPWPDKGQLDAVYPGIIVAVLECRIEDSLEWSILARNWAFHERQHTKTIPLASDRILGG